MGLLDLVLPPACAGCGRYGATLCRLCVAGLRPPAAPADRFLAPDPGVVVGDALELAVAAFAYEGTLRKALAGLKYGSAARVAGPLAERAAARFGDLAAVAGDGGPGAGADPSATAPRARLQPGRPAGGRPRARRRPADADLLLRQRATTRQHRLDRAARLRNLRDAFAVRPDARAPPVVILVDDILTTSATLEACAAVLRDAGAAHVFGFALAREV